MTTNNRMELLAAIVGLEALNQPCDVTLYSDSRYLVDAVSKGWAVKWRRNGWIRNKREAAVNPDLWERLLNLLERHNTDFRWVRGHSGNPDNERCDALATTAAHQKGLTADQAIHPTIPAVCAFSQIRIRMKGAAGPEGESLKERLTAGRWATIVPTRPFGCNR